MDTVSIRSRGARFQSAAARAFQRGIASGLASAIIVESETHQTKTVIFSGGVFQTELLLQDLHELLISSSREVWTNREVPPNDGGISVGQAALAALSVFDAKN